MTGDKYRKFSAAEDLRLVACVKKHPVLYNHEDFPSRNVQLMREGWQAVAEELQINEESCKRRWRDIRDHYFKIKRKEEITKQPASTKWPIFDKLNFLEFSVRVYKRRTRVYHDDSMDQEDDYPSDMYEPETTFKIEASLPSEDSGSQLEYALVAPPVEADTSCHRSPEEAGSRTAEEDDVDVFMRSVALTVRRFPPKLRAEAKMKILSLITELEFPND